MGKGCQRNLEKISSMQEKYTVSDLMIMANVNRKLA